MKLERIAFITIYFGLGVFIIAIGLFLWKESLTIDRQINEEKLGALGSFTSGIIGTVWALAGVLLFYVALKEQRRDIELNRDTLQLQVEALNQQIKEFELQRNELEETRKVFEEQTETQKLQRFEQTLFQLIQLHVDTVSRLSYSKHGFEGFTTYEGRDVFDTVKSELEYFKQGVRDDSGTQQLVKVTSVQEVPKYLNDYYYSKFYYRYEGILNHYFRHLYHIYKFIHKSNLITRKQRKFYSSLVRAQLSQNELHVILFNSMIQDYGNPRFLFLIKEYNVLKNFNFKNFSNEYFSSYFFELLSEVKDPFAN